MPSVRSQTLSNSTITVVHTDGTSVTVPILSVMATYNATGGTAAAKKTAAINFILNTILTAMGSRFTSANFTIDFDPVAQKFTSLVIT